MPIVVLDIEPVVIIIRVRDIRRYKNLVRIENAPEYYVYRG